MRLLTLQEAIALDNRQAQSLYQQHVNAGLLKAYSLLGFANLDIESAEGVVIRLRDGRTLLDFSSALGIAGLGHNHPRILAAERMCHALKLVDAFKLGPLKLHAALAHNLAQFLPQPLEVSFFTTSGAEAVEAAMKLCEKAQGPARTKFLTTTGAFHGKTHGALSLTTADSFQDGFLLGLPAEQVVEVPFGDAEALGRALREHRTADGESQLVAMIVEPIQGEGVVEAPPGYLSKVVALCHAHHVLVIFDEVKVGMGRTGTFCAFQAEDVVPDVVTLSKALGGGKRAMGAMVTSAALFQKAYGKQKDWAAHTTTFGALGETCAVAIETLNVLRDERLIDAAAEKGAYLKGRLLELHRKHPPKIAEIRGRGLLQGVRLNLNSLTKGVANLLGDAGEMGLFKTLDGAMMACIVRELGQQHNILTHFSPGDRSVLHVMPPLMVEKAQLDRFVEALDLVLSKNTVGLLTAFLKAT